MKCNVCGGNLKFNNGIYVCEHCGTNQAIESLFESIEVYICYIENDIQGRRTKDSIIAQNIYNKLENVKIHTFYKRISAAEITDEIEVNAVCYAAINKSEIVIIVGTSVENFQNILKKEGDIIDYSKVIIPVYSDIDASLLPSELSRLQAMNYDNVGSKTELVNILLKKLGRGKEIDINDLAQRNRSKKKTRICISLISSLAIVVGIFAYVIFGTPYILKSKKYSYADSILSQGKTIEALDVFSDIEGYQDSANRIKEIYSTYNGYFTNEEKNLSLHLIIDTNLRATIEIMQIEQYNVTRINTSALIEKNVVNFEFRDNLNNYGTGIIELKDDGINLMISISENFENTSMKDVEYFFALENKTDVPLEIPITKEDLISWIKTPTTLEDLSTRGYEFVETKYSSIMQVKNNDIYLHIVSLDGSDASSDDVILRILAPAKLLLPDKVDSQFAACEEDDLLYIAGYNMRQISGMNGLEDVDDETYTGILQDESEVILAYKYHPAFDSNWYDYYVLFSNLLEGKIVGEDSESYYILEEFAEYEGIGQIKDNKMNISLYKVKKADFERSKIYEEELNNVTSYTRDMNIDQVLEKYGTEHGVTLKRDFSD